VLKGAIDHVKAGEIGGWIYSESKPLRDCKVLAFLNDACIGGGLVDMFREDLAEAGLGDGYVGFKFPVTLSSPADFPVVVVKLEGSDALIVQRSARLVDRESIVLPTALTLRTAASVEWMRVRGWLEQPEYDFLRLMQRFGVYDLNLRDGKPEDTRNGSGLRDPLEASKEMFDLLCTMDSNVTAETFFGPEVQLGELVKNYRRGAIEPIVSLWSPQAGVISVVEGSNQDADTAPSQNNADGAVDYKVGPDRLLFLDLRCRLQAQLAGQVRSYTIAVG
jgi:hypothetical protein